MIIELQKAFSHIKYIDDGHKYFNILTGQELVPTTTFKKRFQNGFENQEYWLNKKAQDAGITPEEMQDEWDCKRIVGVTRGSILHDFVEHLSWRREMDLPLNMTGMATLKRQALHYFNHHPDDITVATELVIGDEVKGGQVDKLTERNGKIGIVDWKTDSKTPEELVASYGKKLKGHLSHLDDCILNGYYIQVNTYREILEDAGFKIDFMEIVHFCMYEKNYTVYKVPVMDITKEID